MVQIPRARKSGGRQSDACFVLIDQRQDPVENWLKFNISLLGNLSQLSGMGLMINTQGEKSGSTD